MVLFPKAKNSPLVQGGLAIPVSIKVEWKNKTNLERLQTKVSSLDYSLDGDYVDDSKRILGKSLKNNNCEVLRDDDDVMECIETQKDTKLVV